MNPRRPNILLMIADDFGVEQLGCSQLARESFFATPNLDRLAAEGLRFSRAYATAPVCTPARASLYTGMFPARLAITDFIPGSQVINAPMLTPEWRRGLPVEAVTIGDALKARGYATAHFGKWHLAPDYNYMPGRPMDPESQGFDEVMVTRKPLPDADPETDPHHIDALTNRAIEFCTRQRAEPFLCVLAHNALHRPEIAPPALLPKYARHPSADPQVNRPALGAMVEQLDAATGRLLQALKSAGREQDTLVIFTSDHGPMHTREGRRLLRGAKADLYEGGIRVPLLMRWPAAIPTGGLRDEMVCGADLLPTILAAVDPSDAVTSAFGGVNLWPVLRHPDHRLPRPALHWHYPHYHHLGLGPCAAIRTGDFKLIEWFGPKPSYELFNVAADPSESFDLAMKDPTRRDELAQRLRLWRAEVGAQEMQPNPRYNAAAPTRILPPASDLERVRAS